MAASKKKKEKDVVDFNELDKKSKEKLIGDAFKILDDFNPMSSMLSDAISNIEKYDDTGCYILNALISGSLKNGGFPEGRSTLFAAPSSVGKSYIALQAAALAQKKGKYVVVFDSEFSIDKRFAQSLGLNPDLVKWFPVKSIEDCKNGIYKFLDFAGKNKIYGQFFIIIDSLGAMLSELDYERAKDGNTAADMGTRAKSMGQLLTVCNTMAGFSRSTVVMTNHIYDNPSPFASKIEMEMPGGRKVRFMPSTIVQLKGKVVKEDDSQIGDSAAEGSKGMTGVAVTGLSIKSRLVKPYNTAELYISWEKGMQKYYGMLDLSLAFGIIEKRMGKLYRVDTGKYIGTPSDIQDNAEFWEDFIPVLQKEIDDKWCYRNENERNRQQAIFDAEAAAAEKEKE